MSKPPAADRPVENVGVVAHGSLVPEENEASRLAIAAANAIAWLSDHPDTDESYRKSARQVEAELRIFASEQPPAPTLSEVIEYRKEMDRLVELKKQSRADRPVDNSELREALDNLRDEYLRAGQATSRTSDARSRIEELFANLELARQGWHEAHDLRFAEISRLGADRLTREDAVWLLDYLNDNKYAAHHDHVSPVFAKLRRISGLGSQ